jgi:regulator of protease activity HflC (stomatin/prohibitin superfamily)
MVPILIILSLLGLLYAVGGAIANKVSKLNQDEYQKAQKAGLTRGKQSPVIVNLPGTLMSGLISGVVFVLFVLFWTFIYKIDGQHVGVVTTPSGVKNEAIHTGWNLIMPWWSVHEMDKTVWVYTCAREEGAKRDDDAIWAPTSEGIKMGFDISAAWRIDPNQAPWIFQNVTTQDGDESNRYIWLEENVIRTKLKSNLALTVSEYTPIQTYSSKRQEIQDKVIERMIEDLKTWRIILDQVDIREVYYDGEYEAEIKNKKVQEQKALTLFEVTKQLEEKFIQSKLNKEIVIKGAEGEAQALKIKGDAIRQNPGVIQLNWIEKWNGQLPTYVMGDGSNTMLMLNPSQK